MKQQTIIIGGGIAGLTAANFIARSGQKVTVLEKAKKIGGRAQTQDRQQYKFNLGPHALYINGGATQILDELGVTYSGGHPIVAGVMRHENRLHTLPIEPKSILSTSLLSKREKLSLMRVLMALNSTKPESVAHLSLAEWVAQQTGSKKLQELIYSYARLATYANMPETLSTAVFLYQLQLSMKHDVLYLDNGWQTLVDGLRQKAVDAGATIQTEAKVTAVTEDDYSATVHLADGTTMTGTAVILAVDPQTASDLLPDNKQLKQVAETAVPARAATLDVALTQLPKPENKFALDMDASLYYSLHTNVAKLAPQSGHVIQVAKYLPAETTDSQGDKADLETFMDQLQPGWRDYVVAQRFLPNMTVINRIATAQEGGMSGRPSYLVPHAKHLYLAGDWVGPEGWLVDASFISGKATAELALTERQLEIAA